MTIARNAAKTPPTRVEIEIGLHRIVSFLAGELLLLLDRETSHARRKPHRRRVLLRQRPRRSNVGKPADLTRVFARTLDAARTGPSAASRQEGAEKQAADHHAALHLTTGGLGLETPGSVAATGSPPPPPRLHFADGPCAR